MTDERKSAAVSKKPTSPQPLKKEDVRYLAFEGGGGKGVTYLGAIQALEDLQILPINKPAGKNKILGIAGASAGAITALVLALGYSSADLKKLLEDRDKFNAFFDGPFPGKYRVIDQEAKMQAGSDPEVDNSVVTARQIAMGDVAPALISAFLPDIDDPILNAIKKDVKGYLYNLIFDRGLFPGFAVTEYFRTLLRNYFDKQPKRKSAAAKVDYGMINFKEFYEQTRVDLVFAGVNTTNKRTGIFSQRTTPFLSIADAVSISMNIPLLFKPVRVDLLTLGTSLTGYWVDGGVQNNLPLHAFDGFNDNPNRSTVPGLSGLHPNVLGLRLTPDAPSQQIFAPPLAPPLEQPFFGIFSTYLFSNVFDSLMAPSEEGQIRTPQERSQTIELFTGELSLTEFTPPASKSEGPIKNAKEVVAKYFAPKSK